AHAAFDGTNYLVVWQDDRNELTSFLPIGDVYGARLDPTGNLLDPSGIAIAVAPGRQAGPRVSWNGSNYVVVWEDGRTSPSQVYGGRVSPAGTLLDGSGKPLVPSTRAQTRANVGFNGTNHLVAFLDDLSHVRAARVTPNLITLDAAPWIDLSSAFADAL